MTTRKTIESTLVALFSSVVPFQVMQQPGPVPKGVFGRLKILSTLDLGTDEVVEIEDLPDPSPGEEIAVRYHTVQRVVVDVQVYGSSTDADAAAGEKAELCRDLLKTSAARETLHESGLSVERVSQVKDNSMLIRNQYEERAYFELNLLHLRTAEEKTTFIENVNLVAEDLGIDVTIPVDVE